MFSLLRGRIGIGTIIVLISVVVRSGNLFMRQQHTTPMVQPVPTFSMPATFKWAPSKVKPVLFPVPTLLPQPDPTFAVPAVLMEQAQAATPEPTSDARLEDGSYVNAIWSQLKGVMAQLKATLQKYDEATAKGKMFALEYNTTTRAVADEGRKLHQLANEIRTMHAPDRFSTYHANVLDALDTVEESLVTLMLFAAEKQEPTVDEQNEAQQKLRSAIEVLTAYPRTNSK